MQFVGFYDFDVYADRKELAVKKKRCSTKYKCNPQCKLITQPNIVKIKSHSYESVLNRETRM